MSAEKSQDSLISQMLEELREFRAELRGELREIRSDAKETSQTVTGLRVEVERIKIKTGMIGMLAGAIPLIAEKILGTK